MTVIFWAVGLATGSGFWIATQAMTLSTADTGRIAYFGCGPQKPLVDSATHHLLIIKSTQQHRPNDTTYSFGGQFTSIAVQLFCRLMCHLYRLCGVGLRSPMASGPRLSPSGYKRLADAEKEARGVVLDCGVTRIQSHLGIGGPAVG